LPTALFAVAIALASIALFAARRPPISLPIVDTLIAGCHPLSPTFTSRCRYSLFPAIHYLCHSRRWLVVVFSAHPAAYRLNHQAENVFMFSLLNLF
jgi:hypothetical protein